MNNIFDKRRLKTFSNCKDLVKSMVGTRDGVIFYNDKFRLDLENTCYKASMYEDLQQRNEKLSNQYRLRDIRCVHLEMENAKLKEDIKFCLKSIKQEMEMSTDGRTRSEMESCYKILGGDVDDE